MCNDAAVCLCDGNNGYCDCGTSPICHCNGNNGACYCAHNYTECSCDFNNGDCLVLPEPGASGGNISVR